MSLSPTAPTAAEVLKIERAEAQCELQIRIPPELLYFQGHFPDFPILPGVAQLHWAVGWAQSEFGYAGAPKALQAIKFHQVIQPDAQIRVRLQHNPARASVSYEFRSDIGLHASGRLSWA